ncbi:hypothetical protein GCM10010840_08370 [Deinococcus aerolatus]|uniref:Uncharacterized protein n=1 Tax=Deinococcus aerolatus TaxID=522487 RepID=A0ABQ2G2X4_9DEIO|nr:hypothetical protein GCM10010840_08370 [Deinococcus aerolatus]
MDRLGTITNRLAGRRGVRGEWVRSLAPLFAAGMALAQSSPAATFDLGVGGVRRLWAVPYFRVPVA